MVEIELNGNMVRNNILKPCRSEMRTMSKTSIVLHFPAASRSTPDICCREDIGVPIIEPQNLALRKVGVAARFLFPYCLSRLKSLPENRALMSISYAFEWNR